MAVGSGKRRVMGKDHTKNHMIKQSKRSKISFLPSLRKKKRDTASQLSIMGKGMSQRKVRKKE